MTTSTDLAVSRGQNGNQRLRPGKTPPVAATDDTEPDDSPALPPRIATSDIIASPLPALAWVVPDYLANELTVLAGSRNSGTAWLALNWAIAVATGGKAIGRIGCEEGDVLCVDVESGTRHIRSRLAAMFPDPAAQPELTRLTWLTEVPALADEAFIAALDGWRTAADAPRLVVIDGAQPMRVSRTPSQSDHDSDHAAMGRLRLWSNSHGIAVLFICRTRGSADPIDTPNEASGILAAADTTLWLERRAGAATLHMRGRSTRERQWALEFDGGAWSAVGDAADFNRSEQREQILGVLHVHDDEALTPMEIAEETDMPVDNVRKLLARMLEAGEVKKFCYGHYTLPG
jgi:hypothetical protein